MSQLRFYSTLAALFTFLDGCIAEILGLIHLENLPSNSFLAGRNITGPISIFWGEWGGRSGRSLVMKRAVINKLCSRSRNLIGPFWKAVHPITLLMFWFFFSRAPRPFPNISVVSFPDGRSINCVALTLFFFPLVKMWKMRPKSLCHLAMKEMPHWCGGATNKSEWLGSQMTTILNVTVVLNRRRTGTIFLWTKRIEFCFGIQCFHMSAFVSAARLWELHPSGAAVQPDSSVHVRQRSVQSRLCVRQPGPQTRGRAPCVDGATWLNIYTVLGGGTGPGHGPETVHLSPLDTLQAAGYCSITVVVLWWDWKYTRTSTFTV